ncbi:MAG: PLP-dependent aminotransferase family protein, partial [Limnobacter sp.]|nr:PLP-dependent aminotransferase family protein [Limnobacter sp.]
MIRRGVMCSPNDIVITAGDTVALELGLLATGKPNDRVIVEDPTYFGILQAIEQVGMRAVPIQTCATRGINLAQVEKALKNGLYAAIFLNPTLQNPKGFVMPAHQRMLLAKMASQAGVTIIEDDVFFDLLNPVHQTPAIKSYAPHNVLYCSSFTKTLAPGFRVGWCVPGKHKEAILAQMFGRNLSVSNLPQLVLAEFLKRGYED